MIFEELKKFLLSWWVIAIKLNWSWFSLWIKIDFSFKSDGGCCWDWESSKFWLISWFNDSKCSWWFLLKIEPKLIMGWLFEGKKQSVSVSAKVIECYCFWRNVLWGLISDDDSIYHGKPTSMWFYSIMRSFQTNTPDSK